jgi:hypothetical protein
MWVLMGHFRIEVDSRDNRGKPRWVTLITTWVGLTPGADVFFGIYQSMQLPALSTDKIEYFNERVHLFAPA